MVNGPDFVFFVGNLWQSVALHLELYLQVKNIIFQEVDEGGLLQI